MARRRRNKKLGKVKKSRVRNFKMAELAFAPRPRVRLSEGPATSA
jgi:hypothetical protein